MFSDATMHQASFPINVNASRSYRSNSTAGFQKMVERTSARAKFGLQAHAHMLRHACGYKLANDGTDTRMIQAYLGHRDIKHTVRLHRLSSGR